MSAARHAHQERPPQHAHTAPVLTLSLQGCLADAARSEHHKARGTKAFQAGQYDVALREYSGAVSRVYTLPSSLASGIPPPFLYTRIHKR